MPVPALSSTKSKLLEWIEPLVSSEQYEKTKYIVEDFFQKDGEAEKLQKKLHVWDNSREGSWLAPFWDDLYLKHRESLPLTSNFNILLKTNQLKHGLSHSELATKLSLLTAELYHSIMDEQLEPAYFRNQPLDMGQFKKVFRSVRTPQKHRDAFHVADFDKKDNHIVILYKNHVYKVPVTNREGVYYSIENITEAIEKNVLSAQVEGVNVGIFTAAERDIAAEIVTELKRSNVNKETLQTIADALVIISIDEESEIAEESLENLMLHPTSKYFDKTMQIVITKNGGIGFNMEHSAVDGMMINKVVKYINNGLQNELSLQDCTSEIPSVVKKEWELTKEITERLEKLEQLYLERNKDFSLLSKTFADFGAEKIKKLRISPDAFFHMALQLAQYRTYGFLRSVYEPVSVSFFREGRTECARATSMEKRNLVEAIESGETANEILYSLMQLASDAHSQRIRDCQRGQGVERHLYGLEQMYHLFGSELGIDKLPEVFKDEGYLALRHDFISTSGMNYDNAKYRMFAPVVNDGHGLAYMIRENSITLNISSYIHNEFKGKQLMNHMIEALNELREIAESGVFVKDIS